MKKNDVVLKIMPAQAWRDACTQGTYSGSKVDVADGFIHLSSPAQVAETAAKHFRGQADLVVVAFDAATLGAALKWEPSRGGDLFPHLYGELPTAQALWVEPAPLGGNGAPQIPERVKSC